MINSQFSCAASMNHWVRYLFHVFSTYADSTFIHIVIYIYLIIYIYMYVCVCVCFLLYLN